MSATLAAPPLATRLFKIRPGEGRKVLLFSALGALLQAGVAIGIATADALFLTNVGVERLPWVYLAVPLLLAVYVPGVTALIARRGIDGALLWVLGGLALSGVLFFFALGSFTHPAVFYAAKVYTSLCYVGVYTLFWNFTDSFFDIQDGKRLFAFFSAGGAAGAVIGAGLVALFSGSIGLAPLFLVWATLSVLALPAARQITKRFEKLDEGDAEPDEDFSVQLKGTASALRRSRYVLLLTISLISGLVPTAVVEYQYLGILSEGASEAELALLFGQLFAAANVFNLLVNLFLFNRLVLWVGVSNVAFIQPFAYLAAFALLLLNGSTLAAVFGFFAYHGILTSIEYNNQNFLFNAVPTAVKREVRTVVEGMAEPLATAAGGLFLLIVANRLAPSSVSTVGFLLAGAYLLLVAALRSEYLRSMVANLKQGWLDLSRSASEVLSDLGGDEVEVLVRHARDADRDVATCALRVLWLNAPARAHEATLIYLENASADDVAAAAPFVSALLEEADPERIRRLVEWAERQGESLGASFVALLASHGLVPPEEIRPALESGDASEVAAAVVPYWKSWNPEDRYRASAALRDLLAGSEQEVAAAARAIGELGEQPLARFAATLLDHDSASVRREALLALRQAASPDSFPLVPRVLEAIRKGDDRDRYAGLEALSRIADPSSIPPLLEMSAGFTPPVKRSVFRVIQRMGPKAVPNVVAVVRDERYPYAARALAARGLEAVAFPQLEALSPALMDREVWRAEHFLRSHAIAEAHAGAGRGVAVLARFYADMQERVVDFILEVLTLGGRLPDFELLASSLRSESLKERGNAIETIEQGVDRPLFRRLAPLLDPRLARRSIRASATGREELRRLLGEALESPLPLEAAAAAQALRELDGAGGLRVVRERLRRPHGDTLRDAALQLFQNGDGSRTLVDRLEHLASAPFFRGLTVRELERLAPAGVYLEVPAGEAVVRRGETPDRIFVVVEGAASSTSGVRWEPGGLIGSEALRSAPSWSETVSSETALLLAIPAQAMTEAVRLSSHLGVELLRFRLEESDARRT